MIHVLLNSTANIRYQYWSQKHRWN